MEEALSLLAPEAVGVETLPVFSEGAWHAGWGWGVPPELMDDVPHTCPRTSDWSQAQELLSPQGLPQRHLTS